MEKCLILSLIHVEIISDDRPGDETPCRCQLVLDFIHIAATVSSVDRNGLTTEKLSMMAEAAFRYQFLRVRHTALGWRD